MAIWQFDLHLLPEAGILRLYGQIPIAIPNDSIDPESLWRDLSPPANISFDHMLPHMKSWHPEIAQWGHDDSNRIDVARATGQIVDILVRIDVRNDALPFVQAIAQFSEQNGLLILMENGHLIRPSVNQILRAIRNSPAFKYVLNPIAFLEELERSGED
jgi:hypothetical protein